MTVKLKVFSKMPPGAITTVITAAPSFVGWKTATDCPPLLVLSFALARGTRGAALVEDVVVLTRAADDVFDGCAVVMTKPPLDEFQ